MSAGRTPRWTIAPLLLVILLSLAGRAEAGPLVSSATDCRAETLEQPFLGWADPARYFLVPDGSFTRGGEGWALSHARIVGENRPGSSHGAAAPAALELTGGASATSPAVCVGIQHPTIRFFARNSGSILGALAVDVVFEDAGGAVRSLPVGVVAGAGGWFPTAPMPVLVNLLTLLPDERTAVAFRFRPQGLGSAWRIDDVYVDPYGK